MLVVLRDDEVGVEARIRVAEDLDGVNVVLVGGREEGLDELMSRATNQKKR